MAIFRGDGGSGDSSTDAYASQIAVYAQTATTKANEASASATAAATSATNAATSETNAGNSVTAATTSATNAATSATNASNSATSAATSETNSANSATAAAASAAEAANKLPLAGGTLTGPLIINEPTAVTMSSGTTAQRPTGVAGMFRYNTTDGQFEGYTTEWGEIGGGGGADLLLNTFTGDGSDVTFTLSGAAIENNTLVYVDGVYQNKSTYAVSGATPAVVTFSEAPANGAAIEIMVATISVTDIGTPSDNTVTTAKIVDGAVTSAKLAAGVGGAFNDFLIKTANYTAVTRDQLVVNSGSAVTITLPASPTAGNVVFIKNAGAGAVTVARNGSNINSTADDGSLATDAAATLVYVDGTIGWKEL
jgi:hypothetical protein